MFRLERDSSTPNFVSSCRPKKLALRLRQLLRSPTKPTSSTSSIHSSPPSIRPNTPAVSPRPNAPSSRLHPPKRPHTPIRQSLQRLRLPHRTQRRKPQTKSPPESRTRLLQRQRTIRQKLSRPKQRPLRRHTKLGWLAPFQQTQPIHYSPDSLAQTDHEGSRDLAILDLKPRKHYRVLFYSHHVPTDQSFSAALIGSDDSARLDQVEETMRADANASCASATHDDIQCLEFRGFVTVTVQIPIELNGQPKFVDWSTEVKDVVPPKFPESLKIQRQFANSYYPVQFNPRRPRHPRPNPGRRRPPFLVAPVYPEPRRASCRRFFAPSHPNCHPDRSEPTPFRRVRFRANASAHAVEGPWLPSFPFSKTM